VYHWQSEREHRTSKAQFLRTSGRSIPQQLSRIERRQHHIRIIREKRSPSQIKLEDLTNDPGVRYNIGKLQKFPVHIPTFLQQNVGDPAIKVSSFIFLPPMLADTSVAEFFPEVKGASTSSYPHSASSGG